MKKKIIKQIEGEKYFCDICDKELIQDGKDIELVKSMNEKANDYAFHLHRSCLIEYLAKVWIPNDEKLLATPNNLYQREV